MISTTKSRPRALDLGNGGGGKSDGFWTTWQCDGRMVGFNC